MFEITPNDIALLSDEDLRALIGRLCESEVRRRGFSPLAVTWGGHHNANDGGLDVRVALPVRAPIDGSVPRPVTGFQVKKENMPHAKIRDEMRPHDVLRPVIRELADQSGAYMIVSSVGSMSDTALKNRRKAMVEAVQDLPNANALTLDFYDRTRVATWVRDHPGLIPWVRERTGNAIQGWHSYGAWAYSPEGTDDEYLLDDGLRIQTDTKATEGGLKALDGLARIRERLRNPGQVVRVVGLSGVGKTRLVQAVFDDRVGGNALDPSLACYTNVADEPDPTPMIVASDLIAAHERAILIVDNCFPATHRQLSELCRSAGSLISLITIEYDIREDQSEGTDVFSLEAASTDLIERLVRRRFSEVSAVDARTIAEFSGGNARIAMALSATVGKNETIKGLSDEDLFKRLFQQRHEPNESLLLAAQSLSLVYSFDGEDVSESDQAELFRLGALIGMNPQEMYRSAAELLRRDLVQRRGRMRAVLPQAVANRLAATALQNISFPEIEARLINSAPARLLKSFSRRLGYLDASREAESIVSRWLSAGGLLENLADLNDLGEAMFIHIAPVVPEVTLAALERALLATTNEDVVQKCRLYVSTLRSLAYEAALFERCVALIAKIAEAGDINSNTNEAAKVFASLFMSHLSGTHATVEQRLAVIRSLLISDDPKRRNLGLMALRAGLEASHFGVVAYNFEFGARSRNYGYWPRTRDEVKRWFGSMLGLAEELACSDDQSASDVRTVIATQFRTLWSGAAAYDDLESVCHAISKQRFWTEGWLAVRETLHYDSAGLSPEISTRLVSLEALLRPRDLAQKVRSMVLSEAVIYAGFDSSDEGVGVETILAKAHEVSRDLGKAVAADQSSFTALMPELIGGNSQQLVSFGGGLAEGTEKPLSIWNQMVACLAVMPKDNQNPHVFHGFLNTLHATNPKLANTLLDNALENEALALWYPVLQTSVGIDKEGVDRLMRSLELGKAWIGTYSTLARGGVAHPICGRDFNRLLLRIAREPGGLDIAIEVLYMRLSFEEGRRRSSTSELTDIGCELMRQIRFANRREVGLEHGLGIIARNCLIGEKGAATVREVCQNLRNAVSKSETFAFYQQELVQALVRAQPTAALEALCGDNAEDLRLGISILDQAGQLRRNAFDAIPEADLLTWCEQQPGTRYAAVASGITAFQPSVETGRPEWTSTAHKFLDKAPNRVEVLKGFIGQFSPMEWTGSRVAIVESNTRLLDELTEHPDPALVEFVRKEKARLSQAVQSERWTETLIQRERDERFE
jgi:hypothetical protein